MKLIESKYPILTPDGKIDKSSISRTSERVKADVDSALNQALVHYYYDENNKVLEVKLENKGSDVDETELNNQILELLLINKKIPEEELDDVKISFSSALTPPISKIVWNNHPLFEISRIREDDNIVNIAFWWIKKLNDNSKEIVDFFVERLKQKLSSNVSKKNSDKNNARVVRSSYKNITFSIPGNDDDIKNRIFWSINSKKSLIEEIIDELKDDDSLGSLITDSKYENFEEFKKSFLEHFIFGVSMAGETGNKDEWDEEWKKESIKEKLQRFYEAEISSRWDMSNDNISDRIGRFSEDVRKEKLDAVMNIYSEIINAFEWKTYSYVWVENVKIPVIQKTMSGKKVINSMLLSDLRKWKNIDVLNVKGVNLEEKVKEYMDMITELMDFIAPYVREEDINEMENLWATFSNNRQIPAKYLVKNYKWTLTKESLEVQSKQKTWVNFFVDIVDMWVMNINDFQYIAERIHTWEDISYLSSGSAVTLRFISFVNNLKRDYPNIKLSLWWDEIMFFIEWDNLDTEKISKEVWNKLAANNLKWRVSFGKNGEKWFSELDFLTQINKAVEQECKKVTLSPIELYLPQVIQLYDEQNILESAEMNEFLNEFKSVLEENNDNLKRLLDSEEEEITLKVNWKKIKLTLDKESLAIKLNINIMQDSFN